MFNERYDVAIRIRPLPLKSSDLIVRNLSVSKQFIVASPHLLNQHYSIKAPEELKRLPILMMESLSFEYHWDLYNSNNELYVVKDEPRLTTTDLSALHLATLDGLGIAKLPELIIAEDLKAGRLVKVIPEWEPMPELIHLAYTSRRGLLPSVKALIEFLVTEFDQV